MLTYHQTNSVAFTWKQFHKSLLCMMWYHQQKRISELWLLHIQSCSYRIMFASRLNGYFSGTLWCKCAYRLRRREPVHTYGWKRNFDWISGIWKSLNHMNQSWLWYFTLSKWFFNHQYIIYDIDEYFVDTNPLPTLMRMHYYLRPMEHI